MRGVVTSRSPDQEDDATHPHSEALQPQFTVDLSRVFHRDHRVVENRFQIGKIDLVLLKVGSTFSLVPGDHAPTVYAFRRTVKQTVDAEYSGADYGGCAV